MLPRMKISIRLLAITCFGSCFLLGLESHPPHSQAQTKPAAAPMQSGAFLISIERTGGIAGIYEKFSINPDGRVTNAAGEMQQIPAQALEAIRRRVEALDVPKSCNIRVTGGLCSDCFQYVIILIGSSGRRTLVFEDPISGSDSVSSIARELRDLVLGLKWK
jgi:hypothetical protein